MTSSGETSPLSVTPTATTPGYSQAPKYGTLIPNRIFVGGITANTQEHELKAFFSQLGAVKDCKIIVDRAGISKGYAFVTFETLEDAEKILKKEADNLVFNGRKLNIGRAIRKQQAYPRMDLSPGAIYFSNGGIPYTYQNGMAVFPTEYQHLPAQPQPAATYPGLTVQPQASYIPYVHQSPPAATPASWAGASQWRWTPQSPTSAAVGTQPYLYPATMQQAMPEMLYAHAQHYLTTAAPPEMTDVDATAAAAAAAEGSMAMEPNIYDKSLIPASQLPPASAVMTSPKASPVVYGKRPGPALVAPPRKMLHTAAPCMYSTRLTPTPPFKYDRSMLTAAPAFAGGANLNMFVRDAGIVMDPGASVVQLTPPKAPEVK